jgi:hexosaminidase
MDNNLKKGIISARDIIPLPEKYEDRAGYFLLSRDAKILTDVSNRWNAEYLRNLLSPPTGFAVDIQVNPQTIKNSVRLSLNPLLEELGREGYRLEILPDNIVIESPFTAGIFYGIQTLRQLFPVEIEERHPVPGVDWRIQCLYITDKPRFSWRGFMLDESRYFHGTGAIYLSLDLMALQKMNVFHLHLTDDQGWRIEIKKFPKLTEVGSFRAGTSKRILGKKHDGIPHEGYYTQEEIRKIVGYAAERNITIVPEIEMPGHAMAALASYPELACRQDSYHVATHFGIFPDIFCAGKENIFSFLQDVLDEILDLFPSPYIHIGGDEAPKERWKGCPDCQRRIHKNELKDEHALQVYFTNRIAKYIALNGRRVIGWNEILYDGLVENAIIQYWAGGYHRLLEALRNEEHPVVMSTYLDTYLDHSYSLMPLSRAYRYEPIPPGLDENQAGNILGLKFPLWSEWVPNRARLDYQAYPRLTAMAETGWTSKDQKSFNDFLRRLEKFLIRLDYLGVQFAPLKNAQPSNISQWLGIFTIHIPQRAITK